MSVAFGWALRSGSCRLGCALVGVASYTNGLGMALLSPSMCRSSRERRGRCLMGMDRYAILLIFNLRSSIMFSSCPKGKGEKVKSTPTPKAAGPRALA